VQEDKKNRRKTMLDGAYLASSERNRANSV
jgi:hypothetical protein